VKKFHSQKCPLLETFVLQCFSISEKQTVGKKSLRKACTQTLQPIRRQLAQFDNGGGGERALASAHMGKADAFAKSNLYLECDVKAAQGSLISHRISSRHHALSAASSKIASPKINLQLCSQHFPQSVCERDVGTINGAHSTLSLSLMFKVFSWTPLQEQENLDSFN